MKALDAVIRDRLYSDVVLIRQVAEYIIGSGGKRLRPAMVLFGGCGRLSGQQHIGAGGGGGVHPYRHPASRRRGRRVRPAARQQDRQCHVRQRRLGAGG
jgi:hypothetical protein